MAKVSGPLFSMEASGRLGTALVFDRRGYVREYVKPANPKTDQQATERQQFQALTNAVGTGGDNPRNYWRKAADLRGFPPYRWTAFYMKHARHFWDDAQAAFDGLTAAEKAAWDSAAQGIGLDPQGLTYGTALDHDSGRALWAAAYTTWNYRDRPLITPAPPAAPSGSNANDWATWWSS